MYMANDYELNEQLLEYLYAKVHPDKVELYKNIFNVFEKINNCPFFLNKYDCNRIESKLMDDALKDSDDVNVIECFDMFIKELIVQNLKKEYVLLDMDASLELIISILDNYVSIFYLEEGMKHYIEKMCQVDGSGDGMDLETTFCLMLEMISEFDNFTEARNAIISVDSVLFRNIEESLEGENEDTLDVVDLDYIDSLQKIMYYYNIENLISIKKVDAMFKKFSKDRLLLSPFEMLVPILGEYAIEDDSTLEDKIALTVLSLCCCSETLDITYDKFCSLVDNYQVFEVIQESKNPIYIKKLYELFEKTKKSKI